MKKLFLAACLLTGSSLIPAMASAQTIVLDRAETTTDQPYAAFTLSFSLPTNFTNAQLNIASFSADDAAVASLNGANLYGVGIFGPGLGNFYFDPNGASTPFQFADNGVQNVSFASPFVAGLNTFTLYLNNNNAGINTGNGPLTGGPSGFEFVGDVTYGLSGGVPEPATWALMIMGFGVVGGAMRRRSAVSTSVSFG